MEYNSSSSLQMKRWERFILNTYWLLGLISLVVESVCFIFDGKGVRPDPFRHILLPTATNFFVLSLTEILYRRISRYKQELLILVGAVLSFIFMAFQYHMAVLKVTLFMPVLISCIFFQRGKIFFAYIMSLTAYLLLEFLHNGFFRNSDPVEFIAMISVLSAGSFIAIGIISRGEELLEDLRKTIESKHDLLVHKVLVEKLAKTDPLTGLYNRLSFQEYLEVLLTHCENYNTSLQLAIIDVDNFKQINDTYGHLVGDIILKRIAHKMLEFLSSNDIAARYGGEEFAVIFTDRTLEEARALTEKIREEIAGMKHEELGGKAVTVSIGLHPFEKGQSKEAFFKAADLSLYTAKRTGKNKVITQ